MPLETATYIPDLVTTNPADTDNESQGAAHLRLIKSAVKASLPNLGDAAMTLTAAQLNAIGAALVGAGTTLNLQSVNGGIPMGTLHSFIRDPGASVMARGGTATGTEQFILLDGSTYAQSKFANLGASAFVTIAAPNFTVDNLQDTGRFIRATNGIWAAGTKQSNQNAAHTHAATVTDPGHGHTVNDPSHSHTINDPGHTHTVAALVSGGSPLTGVGSSGSPGTPTTSLNGTGISVNGNQTGVTISRGLGLGENRQVFHALR